MSDLLSDMLRSAVEDAHLRHFRAIERRLLNLMLLEGLTPAQLAERYSIQHSIGFEDGTLRLTSQIVPGGVTGRDSGRDIPLPASPAALGGL